MRWREALLGVALGALAATPAMAGEQALYVVNGTGHGFTLTIDGQASPEIAPLVGATRPITAGNHLLSGEVGGSKSFSAVNLKEADLTPSADGRAFWCFVVGQRAPGDLAFLPADPARCAELLRKSGIAVK